MDAVRAWRGCRRLCDSVRMASLCSGRKDSWSWSRIKSDRGVAAAWLYGVRSVSGRAAGDGDCDRVVSDYAAAAPDSDGGLSVAHGAQPRAQHRYVRAAGSDPDGGPAGAAIRAGA